MRILVSGGTGFIGRGLVRRLLADGDQVVILSRNPKKDRFEGRVSLIKWDGQTVQDWGREIETADAVINLAGSPIDRRWTNSYKKQLIESRIGPVRALRSAIEKSSRKPAVFINASAVGFYGDIPEGEVDETRPRGEGFLADLCGEWEREALAIESAGVRVVVFRIGIVLGRGGGALRKMLPPFEMLVGGPLGSGGQWFSWVHIDDVVGGMIHSIRSEKMKGVYNLTAPEPVQLKVFCKTLGEVLHRPSWLPVPAWVLRLVLGELSGALLSGQRVVPKRLLELGFSFQQPSLKKALQSIVG